MNITRHAEKRIVERLNINKKAVRRHAENALVKGFAIEQTKGLLSVWMTDQLKAGDYAASNMKVYGNYLYLFSDEYNLITVYRIPTHVYKNFDNCLVAKHAHRKHKKLYRIEEEFDDYYDLFEDGEDEVLLN